MHDSCGVKQQRVKNTRHRSSWGGKFSKIYTTTYPSSPSLQPGDQKLADKLSQTGHQDVNGGWVALTDTVHRQGSGYCIHGHHLSPCDPCSGGNTTLASSPASVGKSVTEQRVFTTLSLRIPLCGESLSFGPVQEVEFSRPKSRNKDLFFCLPIAALIPHFTFNDAVGGPLTEINQCICVIGADTMS